MIRRRQLLAGIAATIPTGALAQAGDPRRGLLRLSTYKGSYTDFLDASGEGGTSYAIERIAIPFDASLRSISSGMIDVGVNFTDIPMIYWGRQLTGLRIIAVAKNVLVPAMLNVVVPQHSPLHDAGALRGKRIGYLRASNQEYFLRRLLRQHGLAFGDVVPVAIPLAMGSAAFQSGRLDAWVTQGLYTLIAEHTFNARILATADGYIGNSIVAASTLALNNPAKVTIIADYLLRLDRTLHWIRAHPDEWAAGSAAATGIGTAIYREEAAREAGHPLALIPASFELMAEQQEAAEFLFSQHAIGDRVDLNSLWDFRFARILKSDG